MLATTVSRQAIQGRAATFALQKRLKTYLVGVDGSSYGFSALKNVAKTVRPTDKLLAVHYPLNLPASYAGPTIFDEATLRQIKQHNDKRNAEIEEECTNIIKGDGPPGLDFKVMTGEPTGDAAIDLIQATYQMGVDVLCVGSKGLSHGLKETVSDVVHRVGHTADYLMHHAPCDVLVVKEHHDNLQPK